MALLLEITSDLMTKQTVKFTIIYQETSIDVATIDHGSIHLLKLNIRRTEKKKKIIRGLQLHVNQLNNFQNIFTVLTKSEK